jgi:dihydrofolate reductase
MREIIAITQLSLDGVMQAPGGPEEDASNGFRHGGWAMPFMDHAAGEVVDETMAEGADLLLGRRTYDIFAGYWPKQHNAIATAFNKATKYAVTHRPDGLDWATTQRVGGNIVDELSRLKAGDGPVLHVWGSSAVLQTLIGADLVDEYRIWLFPVVLGAGKRLFEQGVPARGLTLVSTRSTPSGVLFNTYRPAGALRTA